jgi:hypothetical protein
MVESSGYVPLAATMSATEPLSDIAPSLAVVACRLRRSAVTAVYAPKAAPSIPSRLANAAMVAHAKVPREKFPTVVAPLEEDVDSVVALEGAVVVVVAVVEFMMSQMDAASSEDAPQRPVSSRRAALEAALHPASATLVTLPLALTPHPVKVEAPSPTIVVEAAVVVELTVVTGNAPDAPIAAVEVVVLV